MTKEMTPSIGGNQTNFKTDRYCTPHWGEKVHIGVHSEPKPKGVSS
jgi:hypothetical protein